MPRSLPFILIALLVWSCSSPSGNLQESSYNGYAQGTTFHLSFLFDGDEPPAVEESLDSIFRAVDASMSTYKPQSLISKLNRGDTVKTDLHLRAVQEMSLAVYRASDGYFDPTVGKLVNFWGFGPEAKRNTDTAQVDSILQFVGIDKLDPIGPSWQLKPGMQIDYNAIAQGYTVDLICDFFASHGIQNYMVEVGGEVRCLGHNLKGQAWRIGVDKPTKEIDQQNRFQFILGMDSLGLATSGNYRKYWVDSISGQRYAHTIDPKKGLPAKNKLLSASVLAGTAMEADAYATALMSMGLKRSIEFLEKNQPKIEGYLIFSDAEGQWHTYQSPGFKKRILN